MKVILLVIAFCSLFFSFVTLEEKIPWTEDYKLTWSDFKSPKANGTGFVASTSSGIAYSYSSMGNAEKVEVTIKVSCNFYPKKSWYSKKDASDYILKHEQAHFDISEIYARILRKRFEKTTYSEELNSQLEEIFYKTDAERVAMQQKFDEETNHSKKPSEEKEWESYIAQQLKEYERWK